MEIFVLRIGIWVGLALALLAPLFLAAFLTSPRPKRLAPLWLFMVFVALDLTVTLLFTVFKFIPSWGGWNWEGKLLELFWPLLLTALVPTFSPRRIGLQFRTAPGSWRALFAVCALFAVLTVPFMLSMGGHFSLGVKLPDFLFEVTAPGLGEEFVYRGVLLLLLNELFGRPWRVLGAQLGWGLIIVSVLFGLLHGIVVGEHLHVHIYWAAMIVPCVIGVVLAWLRERSGSLWPCVIFHNFVDVTSTFFSFG